MATLEAMYDDPGPYQPRSHKKPIDSEQPEDVKKLMQSLLTMQESAESRRELESKVGFLAERNKMLEHELSTSIVFPMSPSGTPSESYPGSIFRPVSPSTSHAPTHSKDPRVSPPAPRSEPEGQLSVSIPDASTPTDVAGGNDNVTPTRSAPRVGFKIPDRFEANSTMMSGASGLKSGGSKETMTSVILNSRIDPVPALPMSAILKRPPANSTQMRCTVTMDSKYVEELRVHSQEVAARCKQLELDCARRTSEAESYKKRLYRILEEKAGYATAVTEGENTVLELRKMFGEELRLQASIQANLRAEAERMRHQYKQLSDQVFASKMAAENAASAPVPDATPTPLTIEEAPSTPPKEKPDTPRMLKEAAQQSQALIAELQRRADVAEKSLAKERFRAAMKAKRQEAKPSTTKPDAKKGISRRKSDDSGLTTKKKKRLKKRPTPLNSDEEVAYHLNHAPTDGASTRASSPATTATVKPPTPGPENIFFNQHYQSLFEQHERLQEEHKQALVNLTDVQNRLAVSECSLNKATEELESIRSLEETTQKKHLQEEKTLHAELDACKQELEDAKREYETHFHCIEMKSRVTEEKCRLLEERVRAYEQTAKASEEKTKLAESKVRTSDEKLYDLQNRLRETEARLQHALSETTNAKTVDEKSRKDIVKLREHLAVSQQQLLQAKSDVATLHKEKDRASKRVSALETQIQQERAHYHTALEDFRIRLESYSTHPSNMFQPMVRTSRSAHSPERHASAFKSPHRKDVPAPRNENIHSTTHDNHMPHSHSHHHHPHHHHHHHHHSDGAHQELHPRAHSHSHGRGRSHSHERTCGHSLGHAHAHNNHNHTQTQFGAAILGNTQEQVSTFAAPSNTRASPHRLRGNECDTINSAEEMMEPPHIAHVEHAAHAQTHGAHVLSRSRDDGCLVQGGTRRSPRPTDMSPHRRESARETGHERGRQSVENVERERGVSPVSGHFVSSSASDVDRPWDELLPSQHSSSAPHAGEYAGGRQHRNSSQERVLAGAAVSGRAMRGGDYDPEDGWAIAQAWETKARDARHEAEALRKKLDQLRAEQKSLSAAHPRSSGHASAHTLALSKPHSPNPAATATATAVDDSTTESSVRAPAPRRSVSDNDYEYEYGYGTSGRREVHSASEMRSGMRDQRSEISKLRGIISAQGAELKSVMNDMQSHEKDRNKFRTNLHVLSKEAAKRKLESMQSRRREKDRKPPREPGDRGVGTTMSSVHTHRSAGRAVEPVSSSDSLDFI